MYGARTSKYGHVIVYVIAIIALISIGMAAYTTYYVTSNIFTLLRENEQLRTAIGNLNHEDTIGYAKVIEQYTTPDDRLFTKLLFVETDRNDPTRYLHRNIYEVEGDIVHFDALVVRFSSDLVQDGRERALYLWRRIYSDNMKPKDGFEIDPEGQAPLRYREIFRRLSMHDSKLFWSEIWQLSDDVDRLRDAGVQAVYGTATYKRLSPGFIYILRITNTGAIYPQTVPDLTNPFPSVTGTR